MTDAPGGRARLAHELLAMYPAALAEVYGFLRARCGNETVAEDLTAETFMAAVSAIERAAVDSMTIGWLIVVARRRLVDHWRRLEREERSLREAGEMTAPATDPWEEVIDVEAARSVLQKVGPHHRAALSLRYVDGLSVPEVAQLLDRGVHATEALLQRARVALRKAYEETAVDET